MSTRRKVNKILKGKGLSAEIAYDGTGVSRDEYGWWTVTFNPASADFIRLKLNEPEFTGVIEFCEIDDGLEQLSEMPSMATQERAA
ncbi:TPA: hypothetical protein ACQ7DO_001072 [Klebsiella pneumoniae]|uniref:hypothetical protein n=1 Tax=Klebsiella pneumoniae TaxID=573 RepID=UPI000E2C91D5|nr:hypothetical protein [Klebsiella pneumoniae]QRR64836.1 hypothetical protein I6K35_27405 [Klebsiella pneumoniae]SXA09920.1 Uncharacterised protein [Klebsiella pneumoniae]HBR7812481.1 hypothetical protein [Klebsiella pneumoniae]